MTKQKTTKKATRLQTAVRRLKTGRKTDLIKMENLFQDYTVADYFLAPV